VLRGLDSLAAMVKRTDLKVIQLDLKKNLL